MMQRLRYPRRLHAADLPGKPDMVFRARRQAIFVHGCFWHRHGCKKGRSTPRTRSRFWQGKFSENRRRDQRDRRKLRRLGWSVLTVWECQTVASKIVPLADRLSSFLGGADAANRP